jgi:hypothetical protein
MVQTPTKPLTLNEFPELPETKPALEFIGGQIAQKPIPQGKHSTIQLDLSADINRALKPNILPVLIRSCPARLAVARSYWGEGGSSFVCQSGSIGISAPFLFALIVRLFRR